MKFKLVIVAIFSCILVNAQPPKAASSAKASAQKMVQYFMAKNYLAYSKCIHPKINNMVGGETKMAEIVKNTVEQTEKQGFTFMQIKIGEPTKVVASNGELETIIPETTKLKSAKGFYNDTSYLLAISTDNGATWHFVDTNGKTWDQVKTMFPNLSSQLVIPAKGKPVFSNS